MVRRVSVQLMFLFCGFVVFSFVQVVPCMAQESANLGIFSATANWGLAPEFGPRQGMFKVPGRVEVSGDEGDLVYDIYGNGDDIWKLSDEGFFVYANRSGSWSLSAKVKWIDTGEPLNYMSKVGPMIRNQAAQSDSKTFFTFLRYGEYDKPGDTVKSMFRFTKGSRPSSTNKYGKNHPLPEPGQDVYLRVTRVAKFNIVYSEWSYDGIEWNFQHSEKIHLGDTVSYGIAITNHADNKKLAHAQLSELKLLPMQSITAERELQLIDDNIYATIEIINPSSTKSITILEHPPAQYTFDNISHGGIVKNDRIQWNITLDPGLTVLRYTARPISNQIFNSNNFSGTIGSITIFGDSSPVEYQVFKNTFYWMIFMGIPFVLFIIHFSIYLFYPKLTEYFYFSLFLLSVSIGHFNTFIPFPFMKVYLFGSIGYLQWSIIILFFHKLVFSRLSLYSWLLFFFVPLPYLYYIPLYFIWVLRLEILRIIIFAYWKRLEGKLFFSLGLFGWFFMNTPYFNSIFSIHYYTNIQGGFANLFFLIFMTIYLTYRFAKIQKRYATLNIELEDRVDRRTKELEHANEELDTTNQYLNNANSELQEANAQLIQLDQMKTQFVSQASHDLRTPLTAIKGSLDNLLMGIAGALNEKQQKVMTRATTSVDRLTNLINDVLDLNRIETGRIVLEKSDIPFKTLVDNIINENHPAADLKKITLNAKLGEEINLHIDGSKIERVVGELISNAIKYTPENGKVDIGLSHVADAVSLTVKDSGIGMTAEECEKIWERFYRTAASQKFAKGSGLGLSIAKELVELHEGTIRLISEQGKGTTFTLTLPMHKK